MSVQFSKPQDYLSVSGHAAMIRQDSMVKVSYLSTATVNNFDLLTAPATRLAGISIIASAVLATGSMAVVVSRVRGGALTTLATFVLSTSLNVLADAVADFSSQILPGVDVQAGDGIEVTSTPTAPTAISLAIVLQFAANGPR